MTSGTQREYINDEADRIVIAAAKIIKAEIREKEYNINMYPSNDDIADINNSKEWIPRHLRTF